MILNLHLLFGLVYIIQLQLKSGRKKNSDIKWDYKWILIIFCKPVIYWILKFSQLLYIGKLVMVMGSRDHVICQGLETFGHLKKQIWAI